MDTEKLMSPLMVPQGYQGFPLYFKPGVGQNIALHAVPAVKTSTHLDYYNFYLSSSVHSSLFFPKLL